ncbi:lytic murein transglycosylase [Dactylosporangium sp. CS-047395]|uniref:lytic transglycosylase domain-containing protein n=1 Tax=Dactylosporangium sp. CS-047395 TaxID=3239936 RepID=UPI003D8EABFE
MARDDETPDAERPTTVDTAEASDPTAPAPASTAAAIRPPVPREPADERSIPVEITAPDLSKPEHEPKHLAEAGKRPSWLESRRSAPAASTSVDVLEAANPRWARSEARRERFDRIKARPGFRFLLPGVLLAVLLAAAGTAGAVVAGASKPSADVAESGPAPGGTNGAPPMTGAPETGQAPRPEDPSASPTFSPPPGTLQRPADVYGAWAASRSVRLDIPVVALQAYGYAEAVAARTTPKCHLTWTTLAGIGKVESDHGRTNGSVLQDDGRSVPPVVGPPLDGQNNRQSVADTDQGTMDNDRTWDRAVGPMQFLPSTWKQYGLDADADGVIDINDIDDAALTAAKFLCDNGRDLATLEGWNSAIHAYNVPEEYRAAVFNATNDYGRKDRQS